MQNNHSLDILLAYIGRHTNNTAFEYCRIGIDNCFNFERGDVFTAPTQSLLFAIHKVKITIFIHAPQIASINPHVFKQLKTLFRHLIIATGSHVHALRARNKLSEFHRACLGAIIIDDFHIPASNSLTTRAWAYFVNGVGQTAIALCHAVDFEQFCIKARFKVMPDIDWSRSADHETKRVVAITGTLSSLHQNRDNPADVVCFGTLPFTTVIP